MKSIVLLFAILLILPWSASAQKKFLKGFYIDQAGDTVHGFITSRTRYGPAFSFRPTLEAESKIFYATDVRYFELEDGTGYQSIAVKTPDGSVHEFARSIVVGKVDLLRREEGFVLVDENDVVYPIAGSRNPGEEEARKNYQKNVGTFNILFQGCDDVNERAKRVEIDSESLRALLRELSVCKRTAFKELEPTKGYFFIGPTVGYGMMSIKYSKPRYMKETDIPEFRGPFYGVSMVFSGNHRSPMAFLVEFGVSGRQEIQTTHTRDEFIGPNHFVQVTDIKLTTGGSYVRFGTRFTARSNVLNPYVAIGVEGIGSGGGSANYVLTINNSTEQKSEDIPVSGGGGLWLAVGVKRDLGRRMQLSFDTSVSFSSNGSLIMPRLVLAFGG